MESAPELSIRQRSNELFDAHRDQIYRQTDRVFAVLMALQFAGGLIAAVTISPRTWTGAMSSIHPHLWAAIVVGSAIAALPIALVLVMPGRAITRHVIAVAQMLFSALLIHLSGGRIETHFHVFGSLAFLAFYRDWPIFISATIVIAADHAIRGMFWPESVFGVLTAAPWRALEHAGWVIFEDIFLIRASILSVREMREIADRRAELEHAHATVENQVSERTSQLRERTGQLEKEIVDRKHAEAERAKLQESMIDLSRRAGQAEVATGVLHNVGNVLNSLNVSANMLNAQAKRSKLDQLIKAADLVKQHKDDLPNYIRDDERGKHLPEFFITIAGLLSDERSRTAEELSSLSANIAHIKEVVATQQSYARVAGVLERTELSQLVEDALKINLAGLERHGIKVHHQYENLPPLLIDKHRCLQTLVNLISNAKYAMTDTSRKEMTIGLRRKPGDPNRVEVRISDTGMGIPPENLTRIFQHGFTTRVEGHGFGLHTGALCAKEMGGSLTVESDGPGRGATFILEVPATAVEQEAAA